MAVTLRHRGPDDADEWVDADAGLALGFRRLAIVDLSPEGRQPMRSESGRYVIAFNGEVYNFRDLRRQLEPLGHAFRGRSDTEVVLASVEEWGLTAAVTRFVGMFAFALFDRRERRLFLVRDRLGKKPLYYGWMGGTFLCASELKALRAHPAFRPEIDRGSVALFLRHNYIPAPYSIYQGVHKLPAGTILTVDPDHPHDVRPAPYWSAREVAERGSRERFDGSERDAIEQLQHLLCDAVGLRMIADVSLGAFLSGGIDSSTVVALMQAQSPRPVKTFSIGVHDDVHDEAPYADAVARRLGTDHTTLYVTPSDALGVIPQLPDIYDEPFADSSQIPTFLVSKLTRRHVTVALSGDGGDEILGGYDRYPIAKGVWSRSRLLPRGVRAGLAAGMRAVEPRTYDTLLRWAGPVVRRAGLSGPMGGKIHTLATMLGAGSADDLYRLYLSQWQDPAQIVVAGFEPPTTFNDPARMPDLPTFDARMMYLDTATYLPDDILVKVDRASMAVSLEARTPLLDHRVVEFAWTLPDSYKMRDGKGKWILRQVLYDYVPAELIERPKRGFSVPMDDWLRGPLRDWAESLLDERRLRSQGLLNPGPIRSLWAEHLAGHRNGQSRLWDVLMLQAWFDRWCA